MNIKYDPKADAMRIRFNDKRPYYTETVTDLVLLHFSEDRTLVSIELLRVSSYTDGIDEVVARYNPQVANSPST